MKGIVPPGSYTALAGHDMGFGDVNEEKVDHPSHYNSGKIEAIDAIEDWDLGFHDGNALKYIARHKHKQNPCEDIEKAIWYLERHLEILKANNEK